MLTYSELRNRGKKKRQQSQHVKYETRKDIIDHKIERSASNFEHKTNVLHGVSRQIERVPIVSILVLVACVDQIPNRVFGVEITSDARVV